jgi:hypothetical protein
MGSTLICATIGVALGIVAGTALAASPWFANTQASAPNLGQVTASAAESKREPAPSGSQAPKIEVPAQSQGTEMLSSAVKAVAVTAPAVTSPAVRTISGRKRLAARRRSSYMFRPYLLRRASTVSHATPPVERIAYAVPRYSFVIEGDVTVADYDASLGTIETHEGKTFIIGSTLAEGNAVPWQDYRANLHYRCDQSGTCTLMRAGVVVPNARLSL